MAAPARLWPVATLAVVAGAFAWSVRAVGAEGEGFTAGPPLTLSAVFAVVLGLVAAALWRLAPRVRAIRAPGAACLVAGASLVAAMPADLTYDDGCNEHWTIAPLVLVPALAATRPDRATVAYGDGSTLMACFSDSGRHLGDALR